MKTTSILRNFIIVEHFFFINRSYLINDVKNWIFCNVVFFTITCSTLCAIIFDIFYPEENLHNISLRVVQIVSSWEILHLALAARSRKTFEMLDMIDEKCSLYNFHVAKFRNYVSSAIFYLVIVTMLDALGFFIVDITPSLLLPFFLGTATHDAEMIFYTLLIKGFSLRLSILEKLDPIIGAKIYGRILIGTAKMSGEFSMRVLIMLFTTFLKTLIYLVLFVLSNYAMTKVALYLAFRELKALYSVWMLCSAAAKSDSICQRLALHLTSKLVMDAKVNKYPKSLQYNAVSRWLARVNERRPKYITGSILSIDMGVPLHIIDLGISYMLIIVQIYAAFF